MDEAPAVPAPEDTAADPLPEYLIPDVPDADILAEWDRKLIQPDYVPLLRGRRLENTQGPLLDTVLQHVDDFT
eukprot:621602-Alexandrium_andersonii.AAC.1